MQIDIIEKAWKSKQLEQCSDKEIAQRLTMIYFIIGLRPHHFPTKEEDYILFNYIRKKYAKRTLDELYLAFDLAINDKLNIDDHKVYDQFSIEYLVRIMNAYGKYVYSVMKEKPKPILQIENKTTMTLDEKQKDIEEFLKNDIKDKSIIPLYLYDWMKELDMISYTDEEQTKLYAMAIKTKKIELDLIAIKNPGDIAARNNMQKFNEHIAEGFINASENLIVMIHNIYKRIVLIDKHKMYNK